MFYCIAKTGLVNTCSVRVKSGPNPTTDLAVVDRSRKNLPLRDATGRQFLDCGDRSWICNAPPGGKDGTANSIGAEKVVWHVVEWIREVIHLQFALQSLRTCAFSALTLLVRP